ncbi:MAG: hypothetical protein RSC51_08150, partial [Oscillospiraceae bacterium]
MVFLKVNGESCAETDTNSRKAWGGTMKEKLRKLFYRLAYLDMTGACKKEDTYFYRFSREIGQSNLRTMRSMSVFMLIISVFIVAASFTHFGAANLRH